MDLAHHLRLHAHLLLEPRHRIVIDLEVMGLVYCLALEVHLMRWVLRGHHLIIIFLGIVDSTFECWLIGTCMVTRDLIEVRESRHSRR